MTQEQKDLLIKDLCARLPYGVKCTYYDKCVDEEDEGTITGMQNGTYFVIDGVCIDVENVKPYLFPMSSMTEEQKKEYDYWQHHILIGHYEWGDIVDEVELWESPASFEYLIANHFDDRGLIERGLAIDATNLNIY